MEGAKKFSLLGFGQEIWLMKLGCCKHPNACATMPLILHTRSGDAQALKACIAAAASSTAFQVQTYVGDANFNKSGSKAPFKARVCLSIDDDRSLIDPNSIATYLGKLISAFSVLVDPIVQSPAILFISVLVL